MVQYDIDINNYGSKHLELVCVIDALCGGAGFAGKDLPDSPPTRRPIADFICFEKKQLPDIYNLPRTKRIRELSARTAYDVDNTDLRKELTRERLKWLKEYDFEHYLSELSTLAKAIKDPTQRRVRLDQSTSLKQLYELALYQLGEIEQPYYPDVLTNTSGISPPLIPTEKDLELTIGEVSKLLAEKGFDPKGKLYSTEKNPFASAIEAWRKSERYLEEKEFLPLYQKIMNTFIEEFSEAYPAFPRDAEIVAKPVPPGAKFSGSFTFIYPNTGEAYIVPDKTTTIRELFCRSFHEFNHFWQALLQTSYYQKTGDLFPATNTMSTNSVILPEGYSDHALDLSPEIVRKVSKEVWENLELLKKITEIETGSVAYLISLKKCEKPDIQEEELVKIAIGHGQSPSAAERRVAGILNITEPTRMIKTFAYSPHYHTGGKTVGNAIKKFGSEKTMEVLFNPEIGVLSPSTLICKMMELYG
jgi:hypothetical protein